MNTINGTAMSYGLLGVQRGQRMLREDAQEIADASIAHSRDPNQEVPDYAKDAEFEKPLVGLIEDNQQVSASVKVIKAESDMIGTLLDETA
jgi:hypothetical protein